MRYLIAAILICGLMLLVAYALEQDGKAPNPYSLDKLHAWANQVVWEYGGKNKIEGGSYDICFELGGGVWSKNKGFEKEPSDLYTPKYSQDLVDACALVLHGAEY